jgi:hypothetical protein
MNRRKRSFFFVLCLYILFSRLPAYAWDGDYFDFFTPAFLTRTAAMGGLHSAMADDLSTLFNNPAGLYSAEPRFSVAGINFSMYGDVRDIVAELATGVSSGTTVARRYGVLNLRGPISLSYVGNGMGFGVYNASNVRLWAYTLPVPLTGAIFEETLLAIGGFAFQIPLPAKWNSSLDVGLAIVPFMTWRGQSTVRDNILVALGSYLDPFSAIANEPFQIVKGAGVEFGLLYSYDDLLAVGITGRDLTFVEGSDYTSYSTFLSGEVPTTWTSVLPLDITLGFEIHPSLKRLGIYGTDIRFLLDYHDIFDFLIYPDGATAPLLHIGIGMELSLLQVMHLRAGFYQWLPSVGLGLDLTIFTLNMAFFGREMTADLGGYPTYCFMFELDFNY